MFQGVSNYTPHYDFAINFKLIKDILDGIDISQFIYFYNKWLLFCHKLLKYKPRYDFQSKIFWHSDFESFSDNLFPLLLTGNKLRLPDSENEAKQNRHEFPGASFIIKCLEDFGKVTGFYKSFCPFFSESLHVHFNPSQNVSPILLLHGLVMVLQMFQKRNVREYSF